MTNLQKLNELFDQGHEIKRNFQTQLAMQLKEEINPKRAAINLSNDLTPDGKKKQIKALEERYARDVFEAVKGQRAEYVKLASEATALAKKVKAAAIKEPADKADLAIFEKEFAALKTSVQLSPRVESAVSAVSAFTSKWSDNDVYYADRIASDFGQIATAINTLGADGKQRESLNRVYKLVTEKTNTDEIKAANQALEYFSDGENVQLFFKGGNAFSTVKTAIGAVAEHINSPEQALGVLSGEVQTFAGIAGANIVE